MPTTTRAVKTARAKILKDLRRYLDAPEEERTPILRSVAETFIGARETFLRPDGTPDWNGRTHAYRAWVREIYGDLNVSKEDRATIQAAIRYHVGAALRKRLDDETLADYGLIQESPRERSKDRRDNRSALLSALTAREVAGGALIALSTAFTVLSKVDPAEIVALPERERAVAEDTLSDLEKRVRSIRRRVANGAGGSAGTVSDLQG